MYQYWFINCNKYTTLIKMLIIGKTVTGKKYIGTLYTFCSVFLYT